jgi:hypothetical protein
MQAVGSLAASTVVVGTSLGGSDLAEIALENPALWLSECDQNCHFAAKDQGGFAGEGQKELIQANSALGRSDERPDGPNHASNCWNSRLLYRDLCLYQVCPL